ncbi:hypothetical protein ACX0FC_18385, partial [Enterococcus faecium]
MLHAGLYYAPGILRALLCAPGRRALVDFAIARGVPHRLCGRLVVATEPAESAARETLYHRAAANGAEGCRLREAREAQA